MTAGAVPAVICVCASFAEITLYKSLKQFIAVNASDKASGIVVGRYVCRILGKNIAHKLIYGIISLFIESLIHRSEYLFHLMIAFILDGECHCFILHNQYLPYK